MAVIKNLDELNAKKAEARKSLEGFRVVVGLATCGIAAGANPVRNAFEEGIKENGLKNVTVSRTGCVGLCQYEPIAEVYEPGKERVTYIKMTAEKAKEIVEKHLKGGKPVEEYTIGKSSLAE